jgi:hypothetical protein
MLRAAFALNNAGVTLLEQGRTEDALKTFADYIFTMHTLLSSEETATVSSSSSRSSTRSIDDLIHSANARLTQQQGSSPPPPPQSSNDPTRRQVSVYPIDNDLEGLTSALKLRSTQSCMSPVRFRGDSLNHDSNEGPDMDLISATIMYNKGLAHVLAALASCSDDSHFSASSSAAAKKQEKHLIVAATSFTMAHAMLTNHLESCQGILFSEFWNLQLNALVLTNLMHLYQYQGSHQHSQCVSVCLAEVLDLIEHYHGNIVSMQIVVGNHVLAPAA